MARLCTLASGSGGNSTYISTSDGDILVDAGISYKSFVTALECAGGDISKLQAIAITHTHTDHIKGLKTFLKKVKIPVIASELTLKYLCKNNWLPPDAKLIAADNGVTIGDMKIDFFATSHDAEGSGGYVVNFSDGRRAAVCTDLGVMTDDIRQRLYGCNTVVIESNHDVDMLQHGPYPAHLKLRILSEEGHLSNNACATELPQLLKSGTTRIILGHLSEENNTPLLARSAAKTMLSQIGAQEGADYILETAKQKTVGVTVF